MTIRPWQCVALAVALAVPSAIASRSHRAATAGHSKSARHGKHFLTLAKATKPAGQRTIDSARTREIQQALIDRNYLPGQPSGEWDSETEAAMMKFQSDNGWQTKLMPDSRALIKLGLGPGGSTSSATSATASAEVPVSNEANTLATAHSILN